MVSLWCQSDSWEVRPRTHDRREVIFCDSNGFTLMTLRIITRSRFVEGDPVTSEIQSLVVFHAILCSKLTSSSLPSAARSCVIKDTQTDFQRDVRTLGLPQLSCQRFCEPFTVKQHRYPIIGIQKVSRRQQTQPTTTLVVRSHIILSPCDS